MKIKKLVILWFVVVLSFSISYADSFTDALQDLAMQTACIGQYSATQAGGGWYDDPRDYYTPQMLATRFAKMSGNKTMTTTFYGVCFNYAQFAWNDINQYKSWYNERDMYESQFWLAGVYNNPNQIELMSIGSKNDYTRLQNGEYIKTYSNSLRSVKTHRLNNQGERATNHCWLWIERADGVWFWVDPTWTDNLGYVVYGYIKDGEEIQCRPNKNFCINYPDYLDELPSPPEMEIKMSPSKTSNTTNRQETINDAGSDLISDFVDSVFDKLFFDVDYSSMNTEWDVFMFSVDFPVSAFTDKKIDIKKIGFAHEAVKLLDDRAFFGGIEYMQNLEDENNIHAGLVECDFTRRLFSNLAWFIGVGFGLRFDFSCEGWVQEDWQIGWIALKAGTGFLINISHLFTKIEVSYNNIYGFSLGTGIGIGFEIY